jgi:hypothetical protein
VNHYDKDFVDQCDPSDESYAAFVDYGESVLPYQLDNAKLMSGKCFSGFEPKLESLFEDDHLGCPNLYAMLPYNRYKPSYVGKRRNRREKDALRSD